MVVGINARGGVGRTVPRVVVTCSDCIDERDIMANGQIQSVCARTTIVIDVIIGINTRQCASYTIPRIAVASSCRDTIVRPIVDGKVENHHTITA